jgi:hypothetical protein
MEFEEKNLDLLQNLEFSVVSVWREHPDMTDYSVLRVFETALQVYRDEARGHAPKPHTLTGLDIVAFDCLKSMCDWRLGRGASPDEGAGMQEIPPVPLDALLDCLRTPRLAGGRATWHSSTNFYPEYYPGCTVVVLQVCQKSGNALGKGSYA